MIADAGAVPVGSELAQQGTVRLPGLDQAGQQRTPAAPLFRAPVGAILAVLFLPSCPDAPVPALQLSLHQFSSELVWIKIKSISQLISQNNPNLFNFFIRLNSS